MRRFWIPNGRGALLLVATLIALVAWMPMRFAFDLLGLDRQGISARSVEGSIWGARVRDLRVGRLSLGTVGAALSPVQLLVGRARLDLARRIGAPDDLSGAVSVSRNSFGIDDVKAMLPAAELFAPLPIAGMTLDDVSVRFADGACVRAKGRVQARIGGAIAGLEAGESLAGGVTCDGARLLLPLASPSAHQRLELRIAASGEYAADLFVVEPDAATGEALRGYGFAAVPGGYRLHLTGRIG